MIDATEIDERFNDREADKFRYTLYCDVGTERGHVQACWGVEDVEGTQGEVGGQGNCEHAYFDDHDEFQFVCGIGEEERGLDKIR